MIRAALAFLAVVLGAPVLGLGAAPAAAFELAPLEALTATTERPLFTPSRRAPRPLALPVMAPPPVQPSDPMRRLRLSGVAVANNGQAVVIFDDTGRPGQVVKVALNGVIDGWRVVEIGARAIEVASDGQRIKIPITGILPPAPPPKPPAP